VRRQSWSLGGRQEKAEERNEASRRFKRICFLFLGQARAEGGESQKRTVDGSGLCVSP